MQVNWQHVVLTDGAVRFELHFWFDGQGLAKARTEVICFAAY